MNNSNGRAFKFSGPTIFSGAFLSLILVGVLDYITGYHIRVTIFYLVPIFLATWYLNVRLGTAIALLSVFSIFWTHRLAGEAFYNSLVALWNLSIYASFFMIFILLMAVIKKEMEKLRTALREVKVLHSMLSICASCKKIKDDNGEWVSIEQYMHTYTNTKFSHGICPSCAQKLYPELYNEDGKLKQ